MALLKQKIAATLKLVKDKSVHEQHPVMRTPEVTHGHLTTIDVNHEVFTFAVTDDKNVVHGETLLLHPALVPGKADIDNVLSCSSKGLGFDSEGGI